MSGWYILDEKTRNPVPAGTVESWWWMEEHPECKAIGKTKISEDVNVSTVFLGLDHGWGEGPPVLSETMIFGGEHDQDQWRYTTWEEAELGHQRAVALARSGSPAAA